jgi:hypothetical protein
MHQSISDIIFHKILFWIFVGVVCLSGCKKSESNTLEISKSTLDFSSAGEENRMNK